MNIINEFFVSFILIKLYFKFKVCRKIKFPLLWKFYFSKWKFYFSADKNTTNITNSQTDQNEAKVFVREYVLHIDNKDLTFKKLRISEKKFKMQ